MSSSRIISVWLASWLSSAVAFSGPLAASLTTGATLVSAQRDEPTNIIVMSDSPTNKFVGSPSLVLVGSTLVASHDWFGSGGTTGLAPTYTSSDDGATWIPAGVITGMYWASLFMLGGDLYAMGTDDSYGNAAIVRSSDTGQTWSASTTLFSGTYTTAPVPVVEMSNRVFRAYERKLVDGAYTYTQAVSVVSCAVGNDLMTAGNWTQSSELYWPTNAYGGWLEGNCVEQDGTMRVLFRCLEQAVGSGLDSDSGNLAAICTLANDWTTLTFDQFITLPGGSVGKFHIKKIGTTYYGMSNPVPAINAGTAAVSQRRNQLTWISSSNLIDWTQESILLAHPDYSHVGYQYASWATNAIGSVIAAVRSAYPYSATNSAPSQHDANSTTFHNFGALIP